ncbi:PAS domain-containing protein [Nannocystis sp. SCPEA4]|uniref:PAS domain-containing protein n=1 Tax=Nannocystis sp. SCPEA4 TaxID=2996787 RepID=UPI00226D779A|nr:PAS domain-containing protein [Nannocystis sp. SCPEA4]MCY1054070.1 PAS domain-containing protein [Nannocystis sp. SCPEA4]
MLEREDHAHIAREFAALLDSLPGMVYRCRADRAWTLDYVSAGALELTGYRPDELLTGERRAYAELIVPMDRHGVEVAVEAALASGQSFTLQYRICDRYGHTKQVWERGRLLQGKGADAVLEGFITDITPLRHAEGALRQRIKQLELLHEVSSIANGDLSVGDALWLIADRIPGGYRDSPEVAARIQLTRQIYTSPHFAPGACRQCASIEVAGRAIGVIDVCRIAGSEVPADRYFLPEEQNMLRAVAGSVAALVERARIVDELRASESRTRALYECMPVATIVWQRHGDEFVLIDHNRAADALTEGRVHKSIGRTFAELVPGRPELADALQSCARSRVPTRREVEFELRAGQPASYIVSLGFVSPDMVLTHVIDVSRPVREP